ncbi:MAG: phosphoenolpyruvate--protein phosphotransferase [Reyranellaceae bacterium]
MERAPQLTGSRLVLKRLRDVMARPGTAQQRLNEVVRIIAGDMVAEVCSVYVLRAGEVLELFATQGLNPSAVHRTRLRVGEGLVGDIAAHARPLSLADAQSHPNFAYRPETGEEIYHSLMGVPILHSGRVVGVLVVQNRTRRQYDEEETETLQTIAMVLAELVANGELVSPNEARQIDGIGLLPLRIEGVKLNGGLGMGMAVLHEPRIVIKRVVAEDVATELQRFKDGLAGVQDSIDLMLESSDLAQGSEHREILETFRMFAEDRGWVGRISEAIENGLTAEAAVQRVFDEQRARFRDVTDPYLKERLHDLADLTNRLLLRLTGEDENHNGQILPDDMVVVARNMGPAELLDYDRARLRALVLEEGSTNAHVAIVARALDIPVVGRATDVLSRIEPLDPLVVDGDNAHVFIRPGDDVQLAFAEGMRLREERRQKYATLRDLPARTLDGVDVALHINAGLLIDMQHLKTAGADGVGLYRTEIPFMVRSEFPDAEAQALLYGRILDQADGKPVMFRTLDVGGDKVLPYLGEFGEDNPAMGWRAIRIGLDRPALLRQQLRALIVAARGRDLSIMFPMVSAIEEFDAARRVLDLEIKRQIARGHKRPGRLKVGVMLEVPALLYQLDALFKRIDFLSIGSNDLLQFMFAADRGNPRLAERYDALSPAALRLFGDVARRAAKAKVPVSLCGEIAGKPLEAMALLGIGLRSLSMNPVSVAPVKAMVRSLDVGRFSRFMADLLERDGRGLREVLRTYAVDNDILT